MVVKVERAVGGELKGAVIAAWGLTFKANTDDLRESPAVEIIERLVRRGAKVRAYDPTVGGALKVSSGAEVEVVREPLDACDGADVLLVLTEWDEFRWIDLEAVRSRLSRASIVDTRNLLDRAAALRAGFSYQGVGR